MTFFSSNFYLFSQTNEIKYSSFEKKGILISNEDFNKLKDNDKSMILNFDYDNFRNAKSKRVIQIQNGPEISLLSFEEMKSKNYTINESVYNSKKDEEVNQNLKSIKLLLNIGIGVTLNEIPK